MTCLIGTVGIGKSLTSWIRAESREERERERDNRCEYLVAVTDTRLSDGQHGDYVTSKISAVAFVEEAVKKYVCCR